ncbi:unnamed protein product [Caenorhabditis brenneri]
MFHLSDGPTIEELVDTQQLENTAEAEFKEELDVIKKELAAVLAIPDIHRNREALEKSIRILEKAIDKWEEDEENQVSLELRRQSIGKFKEQRRSCKQKLRDAENAFHERREREYEERTMREIPRRYSSFRDTDITRRNNTTGLYHHSQQSSSNFRMQEYSSDEEIENIPSSHRDRYSYPPKKISHSTMLQQRRDISPVVYRSQQQSSAGSQQERMRSGKSRVTKTTRKHRPGQKALAEIRKYQKSTDLLIQKAPFARLVHEIIREATTNSGDYRVRADALLALQEGAEAFMVEMFEGSVLICNHAKRVTLMPTDIQLYRRLCLRNL